MDETIQTKYQTPIEIEQKRKSDVFVIESTLLKQKNYYERMRGKRYDTKQLNIHMKTLNQRFLKKCCIANELIDDDQQVYEKYKNMRANFDTLKYLFEAISSDTKQKLKEYHNSPQIIKDILKSERMFLNNKLILIKFMKKASSGVDKPNIFWKQEYFKNKKKQTEKAFDKEKEEQEQGEDDVDDNDEAEQQRIDKLQQHTDANKSDTKKSFQRLPNNSFSVAQGRNQLSIQNFHQSCLGKGFVFSQQRV